MAFFSFSTYQDAGEVALGAEVDVTADLTLTASSQQSSSFGDKARRIRVVSDADTRYDLGTNPNADNGVFLPSGMVEYRAVEKGASWKVAAKEV